MQAIEDKRFELRSEGSISEDGLKSSSSDEHLSKSQALNQTEKKLIGAASRTA